MKRKKDNTTSLRFLSILCLCTVFFLSPLPSHARSMELPSPAVKVPPMVKEESISTFVPSEAAPGQGLAVNLIYSHKPRYKEGAPVLVLVPGGNGSQGLDFSMHAAQQGFVEVRFAFPGGGKPGFMSSGIYDNRGIKSQEALKDVLRFAAGQISDAQGRKISELLPFRVDNKSIGAVGWSNGGNTLLVTLGKYIEELPFVSWLAFYESPVGSMFYPPSLGGAQDMQLNKHYRQGTAATGQVLVDFRKLKYQRDASKAPGAHKKVDEPEIEGVAYFDENGNGTWDETSEFALPYSTDLGVDKQIYPPQVTKVLFALPEFIPLPKKLEKKLVTADKPKTEVLKIPFVTYAESVAYFQERDGSQYIKQIVQARPDLAISIFASHLDHLQRQADHPHIAMLYNSLLEAKPKFLRLNPSSIYIGSIAYMKPSTFPENKPNMSIDADTIDQYLVPEGLLPDYAYMEAAVAELSDRVHTGKWSKVIEAPLVAYSNGAAPPEVPSKSKAETKSEESKSESTGKEETPRDSKGKAPPKPSEKAPGKPGNPGAAGESNPKDWPFRK